MVLTVALGLIGVYVGWLIWQRWSREHRPTTPVTPGSLPYAPLAIEAFMRGNSCLRAGQFTAARAAFHQAGALDPRLPYVLARLDAVEQQQAQATLTQPAAARVT